MLSTILLVYTKNKRGSNTDHWRTPLCKTLNSEMYPFITVHCVLSSKLVSSC